MDVLHHLMNVYSPGALKTTAQIIVCGILFFALLERLAPARPNNIPGFLVSLRCSAVYNILEPLATAIPLLLTLLLLHQWHFGIKISLLFIALSIDSPKYFPYFPSVMAVVICTAIWLLIYDFFYYWCHRLQHKWLWRQHRLHHTEVYLSVASSYRHHFTEGAIRALFVNLPMGLVFDMQPLHILWMSYLIPQLGLFIHSNIRLQMGPLTPLLSGPQWHRIHHSIEPQHRDKNFSGIFPIWDIVFGTYYHPKKNEFPATGVVGEPEYTSWKDMLINPLKRQSPSRAM